MGVTDEALIDRAFFAFDFDRSGQIDFKEFAAGISVLVQGDPTEKIKCTSHYRDFSLMKSFIPSSADSSVVFFNLWDTDHDGVLTRFEFKKFFSTLASVPEVNIPDEKFLGVWRLLKVNEKGFVEYYSLEPPPYSIPLLT